MRKLSRMLKRTLASFLAVLMVMTAGNVGLVASVFALDAEHDHEHITLGQILAGNYELSDVEEDVLKSGALSADVTFHYELPPAEADDENKLVTVDKDDKTITVKDFEDGEDNVWVPKSVQLKVNDAVVETVTLTDGKGTYTYTGNAFAVVVEYVLTGGGLKDGITNVQQLALLNAVLYLAEDVDYMQKLDEDSFAEMSTTVGGQVTSVKLTPNSFLAMMTIANPMLDNQTPVDLIYSLVAGYAQSVTLPGENGVDETVTISIKLEGDAAAAANSLNQQQTDAGKLALPAFLEKNSCSYLELLYNDSLRAGLEQALDQNIADISGLLAAEGGLKGVATEIEKIRTETLPALESKVYSMINDVMPQLTPIVGPIAGVEGDVNTLAEVEAVQAAVQSYYDGALKTANGMIADKIEKGTLKEEWLPAPEAGETSFDIDNAADLKALIDSIQKVYDDGIAEVNTLLKAYGAQYDINFPEVKSSADMEGVRDAVDKFIKGKITLMNNTIQGYNTLYAEYDLNLPTVGYEGLDSIDDTADDVKAVQDALAAKATQLDAAYAVLLGQVNAALTGKGYPGIVTSSGDIDAAIDGVDGVKDSIAAQEKAIKDAIQEANKILKDTGYLVTVDEEDTLGDIDAAVKWLGENTSQNVKDAQAAVEAQLVIARNLAISLGYPAEDAANLKSSDDLDKVAAWLDQQIEDDKAELENMVKQANAALEAANSQLPAGTEPYAGKITVENYADDIDAVIAWMNKSVDDAEKAYNDGLKELNNTLTGYGTQYGVTFPVKESGNIVDSSADIPSVITQLDNALATAKTAYNNALAALNTKLDDAGYTGADVESSADIAGVKTNVSAMFDTKKAEAQAQITTSLVNLNKVLASYGYTGSVAKSADVDAAVAYMNNDAKAYVLANYSSFQAAAMVNQIPTVVVELDTAKTTLKDAETGLAAIDAKKAETLALLDEVKTAGDKITETEAALPGIKKQLTDTQETMALVEKQIADTKATVNTYTVHLNSYKAQMDVLKTKIDNAKYDLPDQKARLAAAQADVEDMEDALNDLGNPFTAKINDLNAERGKIVDANAQIKSDNELIAALNGYKSQLDQLEGVKTKLGEAKATLDGLYKTLTVDVPAMLAKLDEGEATLQQAEEAIDTLNGYYDMMVTAEDAIAKLNQAVDGLKQLEEYKTLLNTYANYLPTLIGVLEKFLTAVKPVEERFDNDEWHTKKNDGEYASPIKDNATTTQLTKLTDWADTMLDPDEDGVDVIPELYTEADLKTADELTVDTGMSQYNMSMFNVSFTYKAWIVNEATGEMEEHVLYGPTVTLEAGADRDTILQAIDDAIDLPGALSPAEAAEQWGIAEEMYGYNGTFNDVPDTLEDDFNYVLTITPKELNVHWTVEAPYSETVYFGQKVNLPVCAEEGKEYTYDVNGSKYYQGQSVRITEETYITQFKGDMSQESNMLDLVVNATGVKENALIKNILSSNAVVYGETVRVRFPSDSLLSVSGNFLNALPYENAIGDKSWVAQSAVSKDMDGNELQTSAVINNVALFDQDIAVADVLYQIAFTAADLNVEEDAILAAMNLANVLADEYAGQKEALDFLSSDSFMNALAMLDWNDSEIQGYLSTAATVLQGNAAGALQIIVNDLKSTTNGKLTLYNYLFNYKAQGMTYYYQNDVAIRAEITKMQNAMETLTGDASFMGLVQQNSADLHDKLVSIKDSLLAVTVPAKNAHIVVSNNDALKQLVSDLDAYAKVAKVNYTEVGTMTWDTTLTATAGVKIVTVTVTWGAQSGELKVNFAENAVLDQNDIATLMSKLEALEAELGVDTVHYERTGTLPQVGEVMSENRNYSVSWQAKTYDVYAGGELIGSVTYGDPYIELPAHTDSEWRYDYTVGTGDDAVKYVQGETLYFDDPKTTDVNEFDQWFDENGNMLKTIQRSEVDKIREQLITFVDRMNGATVLVEHGSRDYSIVLQLDPATISNDMSMFVMGLLMSGYGYIGMDNQMFYGQMNAEDSAQFHLQAMVDMIMNSGMGTDSIIGLYGANGFNNLLMTGAVISNKGGDVNALGGKLLQSTMSFGTTSADALNVDFYITLPDGETLQGAANALAKVKDTVSLALRNGRLEAVLNLPEPVYAAYLSALLVLGETDIHSIDQLNAEIAIGYLFDQLDPILGEKDVTTETFENTAGMFGADVDLSEYASTYEYIKKLYASLEAHRTYGDKFCEFAYEDVSINRLIDWAQANVVGQLAASFGVEPDAIQLSNLIYEYKPANADESRGGYGLDMKLYTELANLGVDYAAMFIDLQGDGVANKIGLLSAQEIANGALANMAGPAMVILLADVNANVVLNGYTVLDLNGKTINGSLTANAATIITDNAYTPVDSEPGGVTGSVSGAAHIIGGKYTANVSAFLDEGYEQVNGVVSNKLFSVTTDTFNNITVTLNASRDALASQFSVTGAAEIALEILSSLVLNNYAVSGMHVQVDGQYEKLYSMGLTDIVNLIAGEGRVNALIDNGLDWVNESTMADLFTMIVNDLINFEELSTELASDGVVAQYGIMTAPWDLEIYRTEDNILSFDLATSDDADKQKFSTLTIVINDGKDRLAELADALAGVLTLELTVDLDDIVRNAASNVGLAGVVDTGITIDLREQPAAFIMMAVILADGMEDGEIKDLLVKGIDGYYENGEMCALEKAFTTATVKQLCDALRNHSRAAVFSDMVDGLGLDHASDVKATISNNEKRCEKIIDAVGVALRQLESRTLVDRVANSGRIPDRIKNHRVYTAGVDALNAVLDKVNELTGNNSALKGIEKTDETGALYYGGAVDGFFNRTYDDVVGTYGVYADLGAYASAKLYLFNESEHVFDQKVEEDQYLVSEATCTEKGVYYYSCICGAKGTETFEVDALGHSFTNYVSNDDATCTEDGTKTAQCDRGCGATDTLTDEDTALGHVDQNPEDHMCDRGCGEVVSDCADTDNDHKCDICGTVISVCVDQDNDFKCDICGKDMTVLCQHVDQNPADHVCDLCGEVITACTDTVGDGDHKCDICGTVTSLCADNNNDHKCDECGTAISLCTDADGDGDHLCDICGEKIGVCVDANKDHKCDECGAVISVCTDNNNDHNCDICGTKISNCTDAEGDGDHLCDICGEKIGVCADANKDHKCDECGTATSVCVDANNDHLCDICGTKISNCTDAEGDGDHNCDICGEKIGVCADANKDHKCDECGAVISVCTDNNNDHNCDICGTKISNCTDAEGDGDHNCDICGEKIGVCADANKDHKCDECGTVISVCEDTDADKNHICDVCGKPVGKHEDLNKDHACDYGCSESIGDHTDANKDHACDYGCDQTIGTCEDADKDHKCDYGCGKDYGTCEDTDKDHACDYGCEKVYGEHTDFNRDHACDYGCDETIGDHTDADKDHDCDYGCFEGIGECEDTDKDHACDHGCGKFFGKHKDENSDHVCDYGCSEGIGICIDADKDHDCDYGCNKVYGEHKDADKNHECDYGCFVTIGKHEDTNSDHACDYGCSEVIGNHVDANKDHICDYGCSDAIGTCGDADKDHDCDYGCDKVYGTCEDKNLDHDCDYGCDKFYGTCEDADKDHKCDYGCDKVFGKHEDLNNDHECDYGCSDAVGEHVDANKDHVCDNGCGKPVGKHEDTDMDHVCDYGCSAGFGTHADADKDHVCDYGCAESIGTCEDADKDHDCDYGCDKVYGTCEDKNLDHACDYGCDKVYGTHVDADKDHKCDYGCSESFGTHEDADNDHVCDYGCSDAVGEHVDANKDHVCDNGCGNPVGKHEDLNKDHVCDYGCDEVIGTCGDADKDHACDYGCGKDYGTCEDTDKDHKCDYGCEKVYGEHIDFNRDHACDYGCGEIIGECEDKDKDHDCDYGCSEFRGKHEDLNKDHACDYGCLVPIGKCEDADLDHECDHGCGKVFGKHQDLDKNHDCDYGCSETIGMCEDADKDHDCDYGCDKVYGTHADANKDHACDYGCSETIGKCEDADKDHDCDYGCDKVHGTHADADKDHACDYGCSETIGKCEDADKDHDCDYGCDKVYGTHADANKDHACDYGCAETIGKCEDADKDHDCDYGCDKVHGTHADADKDHACDYGCSETIGKCEDTDKDHDCDYGCDKVYGEHKDADKDHVCDYGCVETIGKCEDDDGDGKCDYGCGKNFILPPEVGVPELPVGDAVLGFMADEDEGILFLDALKGGMTVEEFTKLIQVAMKNDADNICDITIVGEANGLIATGTQVTVTAKNKLGVDSATYDIVVMGDTNCNGRIDSGDAVKVANDFYGVKKLTGLELLAGDTNCNGRIESGDAVKIWAKYVGVNYTSALVSAKQ